jgi:hypothetical protein
MKPRTTFDPKTSQYCCPVIVDHEELVDEPWHVAYIDVDGLDGRMLVDVTEIVAPDGTNVPLDSVDLEWIADQCRDELADATRDDTLIYKRRA